MILIAIIGAFMLVAGKIIADGNMDPLTTNIGKLMYGLSYVVFIFLIIVSLIGGIQQLSK